MHWQLKPFEPSLVAAIRLIPERLEASHYRHLLPFLSAPRHRLLFSSGGYMDSYWRDDCSGLPIFFVYEEAGLAQYLASRMSAFLGEDILTLANGVCALHLCDQDGTRETQLLEFLEGFPTAMLVDREDKKDSSGQEIQYKVLMGLPASPAGLKRELEMRGFSCLGWEFANTGKNGPPLQHYAMEHRLFRLAKMSRQKLLAATSP